MSLALLVGMAGCGEKESENAALGTEKEEQPLETEEAAEPEKTEETAAEENHALLGGWQVNSSYSEMISSGERDLFDKAFEGFTGAAYSPVALLAKQVVSGTNYAYLCYETKPAVSTGGYAVVTLYEPLEGEPQIGNIKQLDIADLPVKEETDEKMFGSWEIIGSGKPGALTEESEKALSDALDGYTGVSYMPIVLLGTQPVSGMNYRYLCFGTLSTADAPVFVYAVTVCRNTEGKAEISGISLLDLNACVTPEN